MAWCPCHASLSVHQYILSCPTGCDATLAVFNPMARILCSVRVCGSIICTSTKYATSPELYFFLVSESTAPFRYASAKFSLVSERRSLSCGPVCALVFVDSSSLVIYSTSFLADCSSMICPLFYSLSHILMLGEMCKFL